MQIMLELSVNFIGATTLIVGEKIRKLIKITQYAFKKRNHYC